jgi:hypothetical protein
MAGILSIFRRLFKHRRHQRYDVQDKTYVIIKSAGDSTEQRVQLIDISQGGMAFIYKGSLAELETSGILQLPNKSRFAEKIDFETVFDLSLPDSTQTSDPIRKRGVKFKWMGAFEQSELKVLIDTIKTCEK